MTVPDPLHALADVSGSDASSDIGSGSGGCSSSSSSSSTYKPGSASSSSDADCNDIEEDGVDMPRIIDGNRLVRESHEADMGFRVAGPTHGHLDRKFHSAKNRWSCMTCLHPPTFWAPGRGVVLIWSLKSIWSILPLGTGLSDCLSVWRWSNALSYTKKWWNE